MDCRSTIWLWAGMSCLALGCDLLPTHSDSSFPANQAGRSAAGSSSAVQAQSGPQSAALAKAGLFNEPWEDKGKTPLKATTLVAAAQYRLQLAADSGAPPATQELLRDKARLDYERAIEIDPKHVPAYLGLARLHELSKNHAAAIATYEKALKEVPKEAAVWFEAGMIHAQHKEWEPSLLKLQKAAALAPDNQRVQKTYGMALARAGRIDECLAKLTPIDGAAQAHCTVGRMLHHLQQDQQSMQHVRIALQIDPNLKPAQQLLAELEGRAQTATAAADPAEPLAQP